MMKTSRKFLLLFLIFGAATMNYAFREGKGRSTGHSAKQERKPAVIISVPLDGRPISDAYLEYLVKMGGDRFIPVNREYLDKGHDIPQNGNWIFGNSKALRTNLEGLVKKHNNESASVVINTSSYITNGLVGCRIPENYDNGNITSALHELDYLTSRYTRPRYYVHVMIPRTIPESRGFNYHQDHMTHGLRYFYNMEFQKQRNNDYNESFVEVLVQYGYVKYKHQKGLNLSTWEKGFLEYFEQAYILDSPENFKENGVPLPLVYMKIFQRSAELIKSMIDRVLKGSVDELVISVEDYNIPSFVHLKKDENWVAKDSGGNPVKYNFSLACLDEIMVYLRNTVGEEELKSSLEGRNNRINFIFGTDEIPQMIYARDLTRRSGIATNFNANYSHDVNPQKSKDYIGFFDVATTEAVINQRIDFVTCMTQDGFEKGVSEKPGARKFDLFIHNSDIPGLSSFTPEQARAFTEAVYDSFNKDNNVGVLDLQTNTVDWELFKALSSAPGNSIAQLGCYSGWNTIGNSTGLGIAHAQVFGVIDYEGGKNKILAEKLKWHGKILTQHLLEDALYNRKIKGELPNDFGFINKNLSDIFSSVQEYDQNGKPGGDYWVLKHFRNDEMRIDKRIYNWEDVTLLLAALPFNRTFECQVEIEFRKIKWK